MLKLNNLYKTFNAGTINEKRAVCGLSLTIHDGDFISVIGGNGAGKSTLLNLISGVYMPDAGDILLETSDTDSPSDSAAQSGRMSVDLTNMGEHKRAKYFGRVFQDPLLGTCGDMQIQENLALAYRRGKSRGLSWAAKRTEAEFFREQLKRLDLGLEDRMTTKVRLLSGGQRQALTLLMATLVKPELLLLDEHTAALDPKTAKRVQALTDEFAAENRLTTIMITHNMRDAIAHGNRLIMMNAGRIIYEASGEEKAKLKVEDLLKKFELSGSGETVSDRMLLG